MCNWIVKMPFQIILVFSFIICIDSSQADADHQKRVLLHGNDDLSAAFQLLTTQVNQLTTEVNQLTNQNNQLAAKIDQKGGSVYTRWGRTTCPANGTDLVYAGYTAGSSWDQHGAADYLCLTSQPIWGVYNEGKSSAGIYGTEYQFHEQGFTHLGAEFFEKTLGDHDAPCAVCHTTRETTLMIPGRNQCYPGWTKEYAGYLVSGEYAGALSVTNYACLDASAETENADYQDNNGRLMYIVEAVCGSLPCPPYVQYREITCVVCSK